MSHLALNLRPSTVNQGLYPPSEKETESTSSLAPTSLQKKTPTDAIESPQSNKKGVSFFFNHCVEQMKRFWESRFAKLTYTDSSNYESRLKELIPTKESTISEFTLAPTFLKPVAGGISKNFWEEEARKVLRLHINKIMPTMTEMLDSLIPVRGLQRIIAEYIFILDVKSFPLDIAKLKAKTLYALEIRNQFVFLELERSREKMISRIYNEIPFSRTGSSEEAVSFSLFENDRDPQCTLRALRFETKIRPDILTVPHCVLDYRRSYQVKGFFPKATKARIWEMSGYNIETDKKSVVQVQVFDSTPSEEGDPNHIDAVPKEDDATAVVVRKPALPPIYGRPE